jgi:hypothetical protein
LGNNDGGSFRALLLSREAAMRSNNFANIQIVSDETMDNG